VKVWLEVGGQYGFGFGIAEILQAVDRVGSIKLAASRLNRSYRYVWNRIKKAEDALGLTLVETQVGGQGLQRSNLTDTARHLVVDFMAIRNRIMKVMTQESARRFALRNATRRPLSF
jgi:molybdate transport system regulatory protein